MIFSSPLPKPWNYAHWTARLFLFLAFFTSAIIFSVATFFPSQYFFFDFSRPNAKENSLSDPRTSYNLPKLNGIIDKNDSLVMNAAVFGDHSQATLRLSESSEIFFPGNATLRLSHRAFFYPEGSSATFPGGTLLSNNGVYFLIAPDNTRKQFTSEKAVRDFGYDPTTFLSVSKEELNLNSDGGMLTRSIDEIPAGAFIRSRDVFYTYDGKQLIPFVSRNAFLQQFPESWALNRDASFIESKTVSEEWIGFPSGSLLAWGDGVFLIDGSAPRPILSPEIFLSLGFSWDDVSLATNEEISLAKKGKFITFGATHPDGTVLFDTDTDRYFLIQNKEKREIQSDTLRQFLLKNHHPILVSSEKITASCTLQEWKRFSLFSKGSQCTIPLDQLSGILGDSFEISITPSIPARIDQAEITFESQINKKTLLQTLTKFRDRILSRYMSS